MFFSLVVAACSPLFMVLGILRLLGHFWLGFLTKSLLSPSLSFLFFFLVFQALFPRAVLSSVPSYLLDVCGVGVHFIERFLLIILFSFSFSFFFVVNGYNGKRSTHFEYGSGKKKQQNKNKNETTNLPSHPPLSPSTGRKMWKIWEN